MIKISDANKKAVRETRADFTYMKDGEIVTEKIRVQYHDWTTRQLKEQQAQIDTGGKGTVLWNSDSLLQRLHALPDFVDDDGKPVEITLEFLDDMEVKNIASIAGAINDDLNPKSTAA